MWTSKIGIYLVVGYVERDFFGLSLVELLGEVLFMMGIMHRASSGDILCFISRRLVLTTSCSSNFQL